MKKLFDQSRGSTAHTTNVLSLARSFGLHDSEVVYAKAGTKLVNVKGIYDSDTATFWLLPVLIGSEIFSFNAPILVTDKETIDLTEHNLKFENYHIKYGYSFDIGFELTDGTQLVNFNNYLYRWDGDLPKSVPAGSTPESAGGVGSGAWIGIGDASLRNDMNIVNSVYDLLKVTSSLSITRKVKGYVPGTNFGGGDFYWDASIPKSQHNGITIFSPTVPWDGSYGGLSAFLDGTGETAPSGSGCWVRMQNSRDMLVSWGGVDITGTNIADAAVTAVINYGNTVKRSVRFDSGAVIKWGFSTLVQHFDKFNLNLQCSVVLQNISGIKVYAENDVEFNTDHPTYAERVVFRLKNCSEVEFSGFNFNSNFTDYSTAVSDTTFKPQEWWKGFTAEGCYKLEITKHRVNACQVFVMADNTNLASGLQNVDIHVNDCWFKYVTNYCFISRYLELYEFNRNKVSHNGRAWHTYGEAAAPTTQTKRIIVCGNQFTDQIAQQSCITPGPHVEIGLIANNYCRRHYGIFIEDGSSSNIVIENNISISDGERADTTHILLVGEVDDQPLGDSPHSNMLIQGNMFMGGGYAVQEYNTGIPLRTGFSIINNHMVDCKLPIITNQSFIGIRVSGNYMKAPDDFPDLAIAGQRPVITDNTLIGVRVRARGLDYTVIEPTVSNNIFGSNGVPSNFPALVDYDSFTSLTAEGNNTTAATFTDFIISPANVTSAGFRKIGPNEGFSTNPATLYAGKITTRTGDFVAKKDPTAPGVYAWVCVNQSTNTFGSIALSA